MLETGAWRPWETNLPLTLDDVEQMLAVRPAWQADAACREWPGEWWYPTRGEDGAVAKAICGQCPVWVECAEFALANHDLFGIWGGLSGRERRRLRGGRGGRRAA